MILIVNIMQRCHPNYQNMIFCHIDHFCPPTIFTFMKTLWAARVWVISLLILLSLLCNHLFHNCNCYCYCVIILTYMQTPCAVRVWWILGLLVKFPVTENCQHILKGIIWYRIDFLLNFLWKRIIKIFWEGEYDRYTSIIWFFGNGCFQNLDIGKIRLPPPPFFLAMPR